MILYGIPNCNSIKKTINWFQSQHLEYQFHNYKEDGITLAKLKEWNKKSGWKTFFNKSSSTWKLQKIDFVSLTTATALTLMKAHPSIIKRPLIEYGEKIIIGFDETLFKKIFLTIKKETK
ncbi:MAG: Spx/MgsR family RNA polymerase-binding regulatory protein [Niastella sp.]|nr:Spx/MgsR family RNA polymerase-binding regulatory protein [Niastella sp.]